MLSVGGPVLLGASAPREDTGGSQPFCDSDFPVPEPCVLYPQPLAYVLVESESELALRGSIQYPLGNNVVPFIFFASVFGDCLSFQGEGEGLCIWKFWHASAWGWPRTFTLLACGGRDDTQTSGFTGREAALCFKIEGRPFSKAAIGPRRSNTPKNDS